MDINKTMKPFLQGDGWNIWEYTPTLFHTFAHECGRRTFQNKIRFLLELLRGGVKIYYLSIDKTIVAYSVIAKGGGRYSFATPEDVVIGPYYVFAEHRGKRYSELLIEQLLGSAAVKNKHAFEWIKKTNIPSLKCSEKTGFKIIASADLSRYLRRIRVRDDMDGEYYILKHV